MNNKLFSLILGAGLFFTASSQALNFDNLGSVEKSLLKRVESKISSLGKIVDIKKQNQAKAMLLMNIAFLEDSIRKTQKSLSKRIAEMEENLSEAEDEWEAEMWQARLEEKRAKLSEYEEYSNYIESLKDKL